MKLLENYDSDRIVDFYGNTVILTEYELYLAVDDDGFLHAFKEKPYYKAEGELWIDPSDLSCRTVGKVAFEGERPRDTLRYYPVIS